VPRLADQEKKKKKKVIVEEASERQNSLAGGDRGKKTGVMIYKVEKITSLLGEHCSLSLGEKRLGKARSPRAGEKKKKKDESLSSARREKKTLFFLIC